MNASARSRILGAVAARQEAISDFPRQLVEIPTENPPGARYRDCVDRIVGELTQLGISHEILVLPGAPPEAPHHCILGSFGSGDRALCFHGTMTACRRRPAVSSSRASSTERCSVAARQT